MALWWPFDLCHQGSPVAPNSHLTKGNEERKITWLAVPASGGWEGQEQLPCLLGLDTAHVLARHPKTFTSDLFCVSC